MGAPKWMRTTRWQRVRKFVLQRDNYECQLQLDGCVSKATHAHHTIGRHTRFDPKYLVASCEHCNLKIGQPEKQHIEHNRHQW